MKKMVFVASIIALGAVVAQAQTTFTNANADISITNSWDNGMPTLGNQGTVAIDAVRVADVDISGWDIVVGSGGSITDGSTGYGQNEVFGGSIFDIQTGGSYTRSGATWRWHGGSTLKVSGGTVSVLGLIGMGTYPGGFTLDVSGGTFNADKLINFNNAAEVSTINVSGGTAVMGVVDGGGRIIDEANTFYNVSGTGSLTINNLDYATTADDTNIVVTISDSGELVTHVFDNVAIAAQADRYIDFASDADASWTWTGKASTDFEALWADGSLRHNGGNSGAFADNFTVSGDTLTVIPEPATFGMVLTTGVGLLFIRKRFRS
jgi:hypothetical protein